MASSDSAVTAVNYDSAVTAVNNDIVVTTVDSGIAAQPTLVPHSARALPSTLARTPTLIPNRFLPLTLTLLLLFSPPTFSPHEFAVASASVSDVHLDQSLPWRQPPAVEPSHSPSLTYQHHQQPRKQEQQQHQQNEQHQQRQQPQQHSNLRQQLNRTTTFDFLPKRTRSCEKMIKGQVRKRLPGDIIPPTLRYFGGPVMTYPINVYLIYYGNWPRGSCGPRVINGLINSISAPSMVRTKAATVAKWWRTVWFYKQSWPTRFGRAPSLKVRLARVVYDRYSMGRKLTDIGLYEPFNNNNGVWRVIQRHIAARRLPVDQHGMYLVLTSADVVVASTLRTTDGFCVSYCAWHYFKRYPNFHTALKYSVIGDTSRQCPASSCSHNPMPLTAEGKLPASPNGCYGADGMASSILHEMAEMATNPILSSWMFDDQTEGADYCSLTMQGAQGVRWNPGRLRRYKYNVVGLNGLRFYVQSNFHPTARKCVLVS